MVGHEGRLDVTNERNSNGFWVFLGSRFAAVGAPGGGWFISGSSRRDSI